MYLFLFVLRNASQPNSVASLERVLQVLVLGANDSVFSRNDILQLCEALRGVTKRQILIKYIRFAELQANDFNPDKVGIHARKGVFLILCIVNLRLFFSVFRLRPIDVLLSG